MSSNYETLCFNVPLVNIFIIFTKILVGVENMDRFVGKVAIVTGSSSGIGAAISKELVKNGVIVAGLARRTDNLKDLANELGDSEQYTGKFYPVKCDITKEEEIQLALQWVFDHLGPVAILINNAAILLFISVTDVTSEQIDNTYDTNVKSVLLFSKAVIEKMVENSTDGHIININSIAGQVIPRMQPNVLILYSSTKHALRVISDGLRQEMVRKKHNIKVTNISPGHVETEMVAGLPESNYQPLLAEDVANACISALNTPPHVLLSEISILPTHGIVY